MDCVRFRLSGWAGDMQVGDFVEHVDEWHGHGIIVDIGWLNMIQVSIMVRWCLPEGVESSDLFDWHMPEDLQLVEPWK